MTLTRTATTAPAPLRAERGCTLTVEGGWYVLRGATGTHTLAVDCTDAARLDAHWAGFVGAQPPHPDDVVRVTLTRGEAWHARCVFDECGIGWDDHDAILARLRFGGRYIEGRRADLIEVACALTGEVYEDSIREGHLDSVPHRLSAKNLETSLACVERASLRIYCALERTR